MVANKVRDRYASQGSSATMMEKIEEMEQDYPQLPDCAAA
jgi:hypothetical protein